VFTFETWIQNTTGTTWTSARFRSKPADNKGRWRRHGSRRTSTIAVALSQGGFPYLWQWWTCARRQYPHIRRDDESTHHQAVPVGDWRRRHVFRLNIDHIHSNFDIWQWIHVCEFVINDGLFIIELISYIVWSFTSDSWTLVNVFRNFYHFVVYELLIIMLVLLDMCCFCIYYLFAGPSMLCKLLLRRLRVIAHKTRYVDVILYCCCCCYYNVIESSEKIVETYRRVFVLHPTVILKVV